MKTIPENARKADQLAILHLFEFHMDRDFDGNSEDVEILYFTDHDIFVLDTISETDALNSTNAINVALDYVRKELQHMGSSSVGDQVLNDLLSEDSGYLSMARGDVDNSGVINVSDAILVLQYINGDLDYSTLPWIKDYILDAMFDDWATYGKYFKKHYTPLSITFDRLTEDLTMSSSSINISIDNINGDLSAEALASEWRGNKSKITRVIYTPNAETIDSEVYDYGLTGGDDLEDYPKMDISAASFVEDTYTLFDGVIDTFKATEQSLEATISTQFIHWSKPFPVETYNQNAFKNVIAAITETVYWGRKNE
jgi:hypothetical protein